MVVLSIFLQYQYTDLATKQRAHFTQEIETPNMGHARKMKVVQSDVSRPPSSLVLLLFTHVYTFF